MVMKLSPDLCVHLPLIFYHNKFDLVVRPYHRYLSPNYLRQPSASMAHCPFHTKKEKQVLQSYYPVNDYNTELFVVNS